MIKNYFAVALRNFFRAKVFSIINVLGLAIGISSALVIFLIAFFEMSFDKFEKNRESIFRVVTDAKFNGDIGHGPAVPAPLSSAVEREVTGVAASIPVMQFQGDATAKVTIHHGTNDKLAIFKNQPDVIFTNNQYFDMVPFQWLAGSPQTALSEPFAAVINETRAAQYFPGLSPTDVVGQQIAYFDTLRVTVTGVVKDLDEHTDFTAQEFISFPTISKTALQNNFMMDVWDDWMAYSKVYVILSKGASVSKTETQLNGLIKKYNKQANKDKNNTMAFRLQPLSDIHFNTDYAGFGMRTAHKSTLYGLVAISVFLLLLGAINFINLTTASAVKRGKEIGIRKTVGGSKSQLLLQFLSETFLITSIASLLSLVATPYILKIFASYVPPGLHIEFWRDGVLPIFLLTITVVVSLLAGFYPAFVLARFKPVTVLKNQSLHAVHQSRSAAVRKFLTVSQFVIAQLFIIGTLMVSKQIHYALNKDLGYRKDAIINFDLPFDTTAAHTEQLLHAIDATPGVEMASIGFLPPAMEGAAFSNIEYVDGKKEIKVPVQIRWGDTNYIKLYALKLVAGRNVRAGDSVPELLVNETYARVLGFPEPELALNKMLTMGNGKKSPIVGVMKDFHEQSLHGLIGPVVFRFSRQANMCHIFLKPENREATIWPTAIRRVETIYKSIYPDKDFSYTFFDDTIAKFYENEQQTAGLLQWASALAIFISCLGLLGLVIYTTQVRTKEIGIRKVFGASVSNIVGILSKDFLRLLLIAFLISTPIAWLAVDHWMLNFAYRTAVSWWIFAASGLLMGFTALVTLSLHVVRAALANPATSLRTE